MIHRVCTHVQLYCTYGFRPHTLKVKNTLASSSTTKFLKICVNAYNYKNKPIKKLAEFQKIKIRMIRLRLANYFICVQKNSTLSTDKLFKS